MVKEPIKLAKRPSLNKFVNKEQNEMPTKEVY